MHRTAPLHHSPQYHQHRPIAWRLATLHVAACVALVSACGGPRAARPAQAGATPPAAMPAWVAQEHTSGDRLCGLGIAGAGFADNSPYPQQLSAERALLNLAGILDTQMQEAIIDYESSSTNGAQIDTVRLLTVDEALVEQVRQLATLEYWLDRTGGGPFGQRGFTYAHACVQTRAAAAALHIPPTALAAPPQESAVAAPNQTPAWLAHHGKGPGGRVCAVGYAAPTFFADKMFDLVVEDVRSQLAEVLTTLVASSFAEESTAHGQWVEAVHMATTQSLAKGVMVTHYWYDRDGRGPHRTPRATYGFGCAYPIDLVRESLTALAEQLPPADQTTLEGVRQRADRAFAELP